MKLKNSKISWGASPRPPPVPSASVLQAAKARRGATRKRSVPTLCPGISCVLATPLHWHCLVCSLAPFVQTEWCIFEHSIVLTVPVEAALKLLYN